MRRGRKVRRGNELKRPERGKQNQVGKLVESSSKLLREDYVIGAIPQLCTQPHLMMSSCSVLLAPRLTSLSHLPSSSTQHS